MKALIVKEGLSFASGNHHTGKLFPPYRHHRQSSFGGTVDCGVWSWSGVSSVGGLAVAPLSMRLRDLRPIHYFCSRHDRAAVLFPCNNRSCNRIVSFFFRFEYKLEKKISRFVVLNCRAEPLP
jgi:hypothetical protein